MPGPRAVEAAVGVAVVATVGLCLVVLVALAPGGPTAKGAEPVATTTDAPPSPSAADRDWQAILGLDAGPRERPRAREAALAAAREHLARQEGALKRFTETYPADARRFEARVRLADVLSTQARLTGSASSSSASSPTAVGQRAEAAQQLAQVETDPAAPAGVKTEAAYARLRQFMQDCAGGPETGPAGDARREALSRAIRGFDAAHPGDRRTPALLLELATLYDAQPSGKRALLDEVLARAPAGDGETRARAGDDLRRLALVGKPLPATLRLPPVAHHGGSGNSNPVDGGPGELLDAARRGRVVVLLFWASWSAPSLMELERLQTVASRFDPRQVEFLSVSLDEDRAALAAAVRAERVTWPVRCDGRGWEGAAVRSVGLNAVPTVWVIGRDGTLRTLNARGPGVAEAAIREAFR